MNTKEILNFCIEKGLLIDNEILNLFKDTEDVETVKLIIGKIKDHTQKRIITKELFYENKEKVGEFFSDFPKENREFERLRIKLGLSIEISRQKQTSQTVVLGEKAQTVVLEENENKVKILSSFSTLNKKIEVKDFVTYFRNRFKDLKGILQEHSELNNLVSINKIYGNSQNISVLGIVYDKKISKNKNIILEIEDLTGRIKVLINKNKEDLYKIAEDVSLDSVIGVKGFGNKEIIFANKIFFPDATLFERKKSPVEEYAVFISDIHVGSKNFMEENFLKFVDYLNGKVPDTPESNKIKYLFVVGDLVAGIGVYPNQEKEIDILDIEQQYLKIAELLGKIRNDINIIIIPGNHDCVRLMEPQPVLDEKYAWPLYNMKNVTLISNPSIVNIGERENFPGFDILLYHGFSYPYYANNIPSLITEKASHAPDKVMAYLLKNRHLAPTHNSIQHYVSEKDELLIKKIPDIFVSGHTHKNAVSYYNNILLISNACWEKLMPYQEKMGFEVDYCKVPMFNLKTRQVKILDFYDEELE